MAKKSSLSSGFCSKCIEHRELKRNSREPNCMCGKQVILSKKNIYKHANTTIDEWCHYHSTQNDKSIHSRGRPIFSPTAVQPEQIKRDYFQDECDPHETSYWKRCGETVSHEEFLKEKEKRSAYPPHVGITRCAQRCKGIQQPTAVTPCHFIVSFMWSIMTFKLEVQCVFFLWPQIDVMLFPEKSDRKETGCQPVSCHDWHGQTKAWYMSMFYVKKTEWLDVSASGW